MSRSKFSYVLLAIFVLGLVLVGLALNESSRVWMQAKMRDFFYSPLHLVDRAQDFSEQVDASLQTLSQAQARVAELERENKELQMRIQLQKEQRSEINRLREMLGYKKAAAPELVAARVIARDPSSWWNTVVINKGWIDDPTPDDGIHEIVADLPVVTPRGVVGKTGVVSTYTTQVILLMDENCQISAKIVGSNAQGIVIGEGHFRGGEPRLRMRYIDRNAPIAIGEQVVTSGLGGVFPAGLLIGTIIEVPSLSNEINFGLYREAIIRPNVNLSELTEVFVITGTKAEVAAADAAEE